MRLCEFDVDFMVVLWLLFSAGAAAPSWWLVAGCFVVGTEVNAKDRLCRAQAGEHYFVCCSDVMYSVLVS